MSQHNSQVDSPRLPPEVAEIRDVARRIVRDELLPLERQYLTSRDHAYTGYATDNLRRVFGEKSVGPTRFLVQGHRVLEPPDPQGAWWRGSADACQGRCRRGFPLHCGAVPYALSSRTCCSSARATRWDKYLKPVLDGVKQVAFAQTEANAGSDPGGMIKTRARRAGNGWTLSGSKMWISGAAQSDFMLVLAVTDPEKRQRGGITMFLVDTKMAGVRIDENGLSTWLSPRPAQYVVTFEDVQLTDGQVLGEVGEGFRLGQRFLAEYDRLLRGPYALGKMQRALDLSIEWAKQRVTFGKPIADRQAVQWHLVDMFVDIQALRSMTYEAALSADEKSDIRSEAALIKLCAGDWGARCLDHAIQVHGGMGESPGIAAGSRAPAPRHTVSPARRVPGRCGSSARRRVMAPKPRRSSRVRLRQSLTPSSLPRYGAGLRVARLRSCSKGFLCDGEIAVGAGGPGAGRVERGGRRLRRVGRQLGVRHAHRAQVGGQAGCCG